MITKPKGIELWFPNGYGVSIISNIGFKEGDDNYIENSGEVAIIKRVSKNESRLCYDTPLTNDVLCGLTDIEILKITIDVSNLPRPVDYYNYIEDSIDTHEIKEKK